MEARGWKDERKARDEGVASNKMPGMTVCRKQKMTVPLSGDHERQKMLQMQECP